MQCLVASQYITSEQINNIRKNISYRVEKQKII